MSNNANGQSSASNDATSIVILPALSDFCEGSPAPLLPAGPAAAGTSPSFSVTSAFLRLLCVKSSDFRCPLHPPNPQFLFDTNEPLPNFATHTKQTTSLFLSQANERLSRTSSLAIHTKQITSSQFTLFFLFDTNERSRTTTHQSLITTHELRKCAANLGPGPPCRLTPPPRLRTMRRMQRKHRPGARPGI
jgi:hypothetical protein